jgi:hypothetical protein
MTLTKFWQEYHELVVLAIQLIPVFPAFKIVMSIRDKLKDVDTLKNDFEKFKVEMRGKVEDQEEALEKGLDELSHAVLTVEKAVERDNKLFTETLHKINLTLTEFKATMGHLNDNMQRSEIQLGKMFQRVYKDIDDLKEDTKDQIKDLKHKSR